MTHNSHDLSETVELRLDGVYLSLVSRLETTVSTHSEDLLWFLILPYFFHLGVQVHLGGHDPPVGEIHKGCIGTV